MLIGYARVSTARQEQSLDTQRDALVAVGCDPNRIYSDTISGTKWQRPGLDQALDFARPDDTLVVTRLDRLGRSLVETVTTIADLAERGINVRVLEPALDTGRPADKVIINVMAALAEWERDLLVQRTREGVAHARAHGRVGGRRPKLTSEQVEKVVKLIDSGDSVTSVANAFGVSRSTISRAVRRHREEAGT
ncbi:recombinase family protein [Corynebacterium sp. 153RC1]|uniref:recombinase family protein n=1 Tax=unclassified Corynebacterium TaxID=2624378 RepID=UPI00211C2558|nr:MULTISPECIES: recombinase family protein [unclassified Corynebacterium]MCQ9351900.1 recombinase family protein [Corynebacterium sp. 209RC1]MCQ9355057.1 recombinase family protein [Corynebacterium sp. 1222RC1]MCQ9356182.1 recombinase family protein [Corynebacterium sp. 122RC1]MCQ9359577.1 recombinase family protein [Corynebacterium sp. 142RC1]MCQ9360796.1 recombinase family protein [Corynebacterium sp. 153RC1]